jgi:hypothetical protein
MDAYLGLKSLEETLNRETNQDIVLFLHCSRDCQGDNLTDSYHCTLSGLLCCQGTMSFKKTTGSERNKEKESPEKDS